MAALDATSSRQPVSFQYLWALPLVAENGEPVLDLDVDDERLKLFNELGRASVRGQDIIFTSAVANNTNLLKCTDTDILHLSCHGDQDGSIYIEHHIDDGAQSTRLGSTRRLKRSDLIKIFKTEKKPPKFVFVSACHSEQIGQTFVELGVRHVVAIKSREQIMDTASMSFAQMLYSELLAADTTVKTAFEKARTKVELDTHNPAAAAEHEKFILLPRDGDHQVILFPSKTKAGYLVDHSSSPRSNLESATTYFVNSDDVLTLYRALHHSTYRIVTLTGAPGSGKSEVTRKALWYSKARCEFKAYMRVNLKDLSSGGGGTTINGGHAAHRTADGCPSPLAALVCEILSVQRKTLEDTPPHSSYDDADDHHDSRIRMFCELEEKNKRRAVLLFDQCDDWFLSSSVPKDEHADRLKGLFRVVKMITGSCPNLRVVLVSSVLPQDASLPSELRFNSLALSVKPLKPDMIAHLFLKAFRPGNKFDNLDFYPLKHPGASPPSARTFLDSLPIFADNEIVVALNGHPGATLELASKLNGTLREENELHKKRPEFTAEAKRCAMDFSRKKTASEIVLAALVLCLEPNQNCSGGGSGGSRVDTVNLEQFDWWHGSLTRDQSTKVLGHYLKSEGIRAAGRFLVRESSKEGHFAVDVVTRDKRFLPLLVSIDQTQSGTRFKLNQSKSIPGLGSDSVHYPSLRDLVERNGSHFRSPARRMGHF